MTGGGVVPVCGAKSVTVTVVDPVEKMSGLEFSTSARAVIVTGPGVVGAVKRPWKPGPASGTATWSLMLPALTNHEKMSMPEVSGGAAVAVKTLCEHVRTVGLAGVTVTVWNVASPAASGAPLSMRGAPESTDASGDPASTGAPASAPASFPPPFGPHAATPAAPAPTPSAPTPRAKSKIS